MLNALTLKPEAFGLDISDLSLKFIKLKKKNNYFSLSSFGEMKIAPGIITEGEIKDEAALVKIIKDAIDKVQGEKLNTKYVICSLPEEKAFLQVIQLPKMEEKRLKQAAYFEAENYVPVSVSNLYLDSQVVPALGCELDHLDVLIGALPQKTVDPYVNCLKAAGLKPLAFEIESQAISRALIKNEVSSFPTLLIDLGAARTSFIIFSGNSLKFTTSIPVSSQRFTEAISQNLKLDFDEAEKLKIKHGLREKFKLKISEKAEPKKGEIFESLIPILTDLVEQIKKYLNYYQTHSFHEHLLSERKIKKILLSGGGANLGGLADFLALELKIPVETANPWINILPERIKEVPPISYDKSLSFVTALGLALRGMKKND